MSGHTFRFRLQEVSLFSNNTNRAIKMTSRRELFGQTFWVLSDQDLAKVSCFMVKFAFGSGSDFYKTALISTSYFNNGVIIQFGGRDFILQQSSFFWGDHVDDHDLLTKAQTVRVEQLQTRFPVVFSFTRILSIVFPQG